MRMLPNSMGEGPEGDKKKVKTGKITRTYSYGRDDAGNRTAKADLDTGEKGVLVTWSDKESAWQVPGSSAKEGQHFTMKEATEITADGDRSKTSAKGMGMMPTDQKPSSPSTVPVKDVSKDLKRDLFVPKEDTKTTNMTKVVFDDGTYAITSIPGVPKRMKDEKAFEAYKKKYEADKQSGEESETMKTVKKGWLAMRKANGLSTDDAAWQTYWNKHYNR